MATGNPYQASGAPIGAPPHVPNYLVQSVLVTLCCCLPFGIVAIVYSAQVNGLLAGGNIAGAIKASNSAKMWGWIAFGLGLLIQVAYIGLMVLGGVAGQMQPQVNP